MTGNDHAHGGPGGILSGLVVAFGCALFFGGFIWGAVMYRPYTVPTDSMNPTIKAGNRVLAQRVSGDEVHRGDVVVFKDPEWGNLPMVKRVVGVDGDNVACCDREGRLTINGRSVEEPYLHTTVGDRASTNDFSATVPPGHLFVLGDERGGSLDSRVHLQGPARGSVPRSEVTGRVDAVVWPLGTLVARPTGFRNLPGGVSRPGPVLPIAVSTATGALLIVAGATGGSLLRRVPRRSLRAREGVPARAE